MNSNTKTGELLWIYPPENKEWQAQIVKEFSIHPITAQVLVSRGFSSLDQIHSYLYGQLPDLIDPYLFADMDKAVDRVCSAIQKGEGILIYGDNDVDGMTGTALLTDFLTYIGASVFYYVPNRTSLRQSLIIDALNYAKQNHCKLLITVDCGITAAKEIEQVVEQGVDVIVTDHHEPTDKIPHTLATLNPKLLINSYPNRHLTGVGVAFKLAHALTNHLASKKNTRKIDLKRYLDLVALGTIADMGSLLGENRILVRYGLKQLRKTRRIGLTKLFTICGLDTGDITAADVASKIAPRLNSLGRIADPRKGIELLLIRDDKAAEALAKELDLYNIERQKIDQTVSDDVDRYIKANPEILNDKAIVLSSDKWHPGVIAIVTTRISKQYNRPTIIIAIENGVGKGSARTIREFPLLPSLKSTSDILINFGGHDFAAGLTIKEDQIEEFKKRFKESANATLQGDDMLTKLNLDAKADFNELTFDLMESLALLEPYGNENPAPVLYCDATQAWPPKVISKSHLKLYLEQERMLEGVGFGMADKAPFLRRRNLPLSVAFTPHINRFQNKISIQLLIRDFKIKS
ncbi:MAG: single-stranded-DNA-specific exonuclease RecJ [Parachlamydiales bacterium]|nr:single-stranded-DNA-specific exonuclease RecJ [Parachlamydiales bacterium]